MIKNAVIAGLLLLSMILGCALIVVDKSSPERIQREKEQIRLEKEQAQQKEKQRQIKRAAYIKAQLPSEISDVESLGNDWYLFTFRERRFMFHHRDGSRRGYESIVEFRPNTNLEKENND